MIILVRGPTEQKRLEIKDEDCIYDIIKKAFNIEKFTASYDSKNKKQIDTNTTPSQLGLKNGTIFYIYYDVVVKDIKREKDKYMCNHDTNAMCANCAPLDPWDERYYKEKKIKYLSFGSYKEMLKSKKNKLEMEDYTVKKCQSHNKNTRCVNCQEKDILLTPQVYRMVDHIEFDDINVVDNFIKNWKDTRRQRFGVLVGRYKPYDRVPLGTKVIVSGIWEPEQENYPDGFTIEELLDDDFLLGTDLEIVGMIYTDIETNEGICSARLREEYFLSSLEVDFISKMQFSFPFFDENKLINSRFVTVIATANANNEIELQEYQVSSQCMALTRSQHIYPTTDPNKFFTNKNIYFKYKEDNIFKKKKADPYLPVDFFIVKLTSGNKQDPLFSNNSAIPFKLTSSNLSQYFQEDYSFEKFSNFSLLVKLKNRITDFHKLFKAVITKDEKYFDEFRKSDSYENIVAPLRKYDKVQWECQVCTFINEKNLDICEICESPKIMENF